MLHTLGLNEGDVVSRVGSRRTRSEREFLKYLGKAKSEGSARIEYKDQNTGKWETKTVSPF